MTEPKTQQAAAIDRGLALLAFYLPGNDMEMADAAQDAIVDIMEALEDLGLDAKDALTAAKSSWDHDRHQV